MKKTTKLKNIFIRYLILILVSIPGIYLFYFLFRDLTIYPVYFLLSLFYKVSLTGTTILISNSIPIEIIGACIAGSAYGLLLILNLSTPKIKALKRIKMISLSFLVLLIANILRIFLLSIMFVSKSSLFDFTHKFLWYLVSTLFVVAIWFAQVKYYKIKQIPFYSDIKYFVKKIKKKN